MINVKKIIDKDTEKFCINCHSVKENHYIVEITSKNYKIGTQLNLCENCLKELKKQINIMGI